MIRDELASQGIIPVVRFEKSEDALPTAEALISGGIEAMEITFRSDAAAESIRSVSERFPQMLLGAGTVRSIEQLEQAVSAGARFLVTPGFNAKVVETAVRRHLPIYPGVVTPGEIEQALEYGLNLLKYFPAESFGGVAGLKALSGPYSDILFIPTGGIGTGNFIDYLKLKNVVAVGGSWLTKNDETGKLDYGLVESRAKAAVMQRDVLRGRSD